MSDQRYTVITIWCYQLVRGPLQPVQGYYHSEMHRKHAEWPPAAPAKSGPLIPRYAGGAAPMEIHRDPGLAAAGRLRASHSPSARVRVGRAWDHQSTLS